VTGGLAFGEAKYNMTFSQPGAVRLFNPYFLSDSVTRVGWTVGAGVETAFANNWSAKLEYLYVDLGTRSIDTLDVDGAPSDKHSRSRRNVVSEPTFANAKACGSPQRSLSVAGLFIASSRDCDSSERRFAQHHEVRFKQRFR